MSYPPISSLIMGTRAGTLVPDVRSPSPSYGLFRQYTCRSQSSTWVYHLARFQRARPLRSSRSWTTMESRRATLEKVSR